MPPTHAAPPPDRCTVVGAKYLTPPMSEDAICARFLGALGRAAAGTVELRFLPQGVASARIATGAQAPQLFELAVSDRPLAAADIDRLAAAVLAAPGPGGG